MLQVFGIVIFIWFVLAIRRAAKPKSTKLGPAWPWRLNGWDLEQKRQDLIRQRRPSIWILNKNL